MLYLYSTGVRKAILAFAPDSEIKKIIKHKGLPKFTANTIVGPTQIVTNGE
jgi:DNA-binding IclR family transcriptional regulator